MEIADLQLHPDRSRALFPLYEHLCELVGTLDSLARDAPRESLERRIFDHLTSGLGDIATHCFSQLARPLHHYLEESEWKATAARNDEAASAAIYEWLCWYLRTILQNPSALGPHQEGQEKAAAVLALLPPLDTKG